MRVFGTLIFLLAVCIDVLGQDDLYGVPIDFSHVGYRFGDADIPKYPVTKIIEAPADGNDATSLIQDAIEQVGPGESILLKAGVYNIADRLVVERDSVVLCGEGESTVIRALGKNRRSLITLGKNTNREIQEGCDIIDQCVSVGQMWVCVDNASMFKAGDRVLVSFHPNQKWISDIKMDAMMDNPEGTRRHWTPEEYRMSWERCVMNIEGDRLWLDNPMVVEMRQENALSMTVRHCSWDRIVESGIENLLLVSEWDNVNPYDEEHSWTAIEVRAAEHCWVQAVKSANFAYALADLRYGAKNITVTDCIATDPISIKTGGRRYAFQIASGELCLVKNCSADHDRHGFLTAARTPGPNVFLECTMTKAYNGMGPHQRWANGVLYDCCITDGLLELQDRGNWGSGHGWAGVNFVLWNCVAKTIVCQNPWAHGKNWAVGCVGEKFAGRNHPDNIVRPDGEWYSTGKHVNPTSLYYYQLETRKNQ